MDQNQYNRLNEISRNIRYRIGGGYDIALILGSGYADLFPDAGIRDRIKYTEIPGFPSRVIEGQKGEIITTKIGKKNTVVFSGRFHYYQGYSSYEVTLPVRISSMLGVSAIIITNAAGGINKNFNIGDIMIIRDHINLMRNPLIGFSIEGYDIFIDMSEPYSVRMNDLALKIAEEMGIGQKFREGIYIATTGPSYETKAEIEFFRRIGADAVGMSTVPEVIVARQEGLEVFGLSVITNMAAGIGAEPLNHKEVIQTMAGTKRILYSFFKKFIERL